jgi:SAM-dependent methyltransferase
MNTHEANDGDSLPFWEQPELVERFAAREPDHRLLALADAVSEPAAVRVLDLGCAGGRNTELLAARGFDVYALDGSSAMVEHTRDRVATVLGPTEAARRVQVGRMEDLSRFENDTFDLVVALGVYHNASSRDMWDRSLAETARVLAPNGLALVSNFTPHTDLTGRGIHPVPDEPGVYEGFEAGRAFLLDADELDRQMARHGLTPATPTETVEAMREKGRRVSANGLYRKTPDESV